VGPILKGPRDGSFDETMGRVEEDEVRPRLLAPWAEGVGPAA
jgi:hypothetical protein